MRSVITYENGSVAWHWKNKRKRGISCTYVCQHDLQKKLLSALQLRSLCICVVQYTKRFETLLHTTYIVINCSSGSPDTCNVHYPWTTKTCKQKSSNLFYCGLKWVYTVVKISKNFVCWHGIVNLAIRKKNNGRLAWKLKTNPTSDLVPDPLKIGKKLLKKDPYLVDQRCWIRYTVYFFIDYVFPPFPSMWLSEQDTRAFYL